MPLNIVFEDDQVIVINKPAGLVVHPGAGMPDGTLVNGLLFHCGDSLKGIGGFSDLVSYTGLTKIHQGYWSLRKRTQRTPVYQNNLLTIALPGNIKP